MSKSHFSKRLHSAHPPYGGASSFVFAFGAAFLAAGLKLGRGTDWGGKDRVPVETVCGAAAFSQKAAKAGFVSAGMFLTGKRVDLRCHALRCTPCGGVAVLRVSRAGDFCRDEAGKRKGGCAAGCRKRASARLFRRAEGAVRSVRLRYRRSADGCGIVCAAQGAECR